MLKIGDTIKFGKRRGKVVAYTSLTRNNNTTSSYYIVELDPDSAGYLEPIGSSEHDVYISMMLVHVGNAD